MHVAVVMNERYLSLSTSIKMGFSLFFQYCIFIHPSIHHTRRLTHWPYLLQHIHCVPAALQSGGEAGCCWGIIILCRLREKLGHRYLIRHPLTGKSPQEDCR